MATGASASTFTDGAILGSLKPLTLAPSTKLGIAKSKLSTPVKVAAEDISVSAIEGALVASRIDYDANGNEGISVKKGGELDLQDSTFHGKNAQDLVSAHGAKHLKIAYPTFLGAHCGLPRAAVGVFEIDHVTSDSNDYGVTIYGSGNGPNTVTASNFTGSAAWLDFQSDNGAITPGPRRRADRRVFWPFHGVPLAWGQWRWMCVASPRSSRTTIPSCTLAPAGSAST